MSKRTWNYRVIYRTYEHLYNDTIGEIFNIHSVHYDDGVPVLVSKEPYYAQGDSIGDLKHDFDIMKKAFSLPHLSYSDFEEGGKYFEEQP